MSSSAPLPESFPAFVATKSEDGKSVQRQVGSLLASDLPDGEVTVKVRWSSVNYKDALATLADGAVARISPLVPGVDVVGEVVASSDTRHEVGSWVIAHGYEIGTGRHGAYASFARLRADQCVQLPGGLTPKGAAVLGTAGFTAAQSIHALEQHGVGTEAGPILVTGATGGVGSMAVRMLARRGFEVWASTGKAEAHGWLRSLGAAGVIDRADLTPEKPRPIDKERWAAAVDCVGGQTLATVIAQLKWGGVVAASGLTGGTSLPTSVFPFILRNVSLLGIDSVNLGMATRETVWRRCATDLCPVDLETEGVTEITLDGLDAALTAVRAGQARGRFLVSIS
jgi:acrylyl-CoA reductase (NADPH)